MLGIWLQVNLKNWINGGIYNVFALFLPLYVATQEAVPVAFNLVDKA